MRSRVLAGALAALAAIAVACSGGAETSGAQTAKLIPAGDDPFLAGYPRYEDEAAGLRVILGTPDLGVGRHRVGFVLSDVDGLIRLPVVQADRNRINEFVGLFTRLEDDTIPQWYSSPRQILFALTVNF